MILKKIWYHTVKTYISIGLFFYFKKMSVRGKENIPKKGALLFVSNHKNALVDPLLIATTNGRNIHFLTRASAFRIRLIKWILSTVNMLPIYRLRDGKDALAKNDEIFNKCYSILGRKWSLLIFPEGTHDIRRWVRPLSKGFTRITFGALENNPDLELKIVPVGLNYAKAEDFAECVSILYGKPIAVNQYWDKDNINASSLALKNIVSEKMKELTTHVQDIENYDATIQKLGNVDYLNPEKVNELLKDESKMTNDKLETKKPSIIWRFFYLLATINSFFPWFIWKVTKPKVQEVEFVSTTKFAIGVTAFPLFYGLQTLVVNYFFGLDITLVYLTISILLVLILAKTKSTSN